MKPRFTIGRDSARLYHGDCLDILRTLPDASISAVVTDPPYGLSREPDALEMLQHWLAGDDYKHRGSGFMGKTWDSFVPGPTLWREVLRVLKPGGHACVFAGSRTVDLMGLALRIAGFEIRDQLQWIYGSGFPKSLDVSKAIDKAAGVERDVIGKTTASYGYQKSGSRWTEDHFVTAPATEAAEQWDGWGTALKPAHEPIVLARKPLDGTVAKNVLEHGTGAINVDGCRIGSSGGARSIPTGDGIKSNQIYGTYGACKPDKAAVLGRWPANVILDEQAGALLKGEARYFYCPKTSVSEREAGLDGFRKVNPAEITGREPGSPGQNNPAAATAGGTPRANIHPTVKPIELMRWLVRLITPPQGVVLDPFMGSGTTGAAAMAEGARFTRCELGEEYIELAASRVTHWYARGGVTDRRHKALASKLNRRKI